MKVIYTEPEVVLLPMQKYQSPDVAMPENASAVQVTFTTPDWPLEDTGNQILLRFFMSYDSGTTWRAIWNDVFQHMKIPKQPDFLRAGRAWHDVMLEDDGVTVSRVPKIFGKGVLFRAIFIVLDVPVKTGYVIEVE